MISEFSYSEYKNILKAFDGRWTMFHEVSDRPFVLMRHDVEFSVHRAYTLGKFEAENSVKSTYNFQVCCETYNIESNINSEKVIELRKNGHEIGLHFYAGHIENQDVNELIINLHKQKDILERAIGIEISTFSFHRPKQWMLEIREDMIGGMLNQYGNSFFEYSNDPQKIKYLADSRHSWDYGYPQDFTDWRRLQILTHPDEWSINGLNEKDNFLEIKAELTQTISDAFLAESPRNFSKYEGKI